MRQFLVAEKERELAKRKKNRFKKKKNDDDDDEQWECLMSPLRDKNEKARARG